MPVYLGLSAAIGNARVSRTLGLLFPTVILLSARASLIGAGAHLVAAGFLSRLTGHQPDFIEWLVLAGPFLLATCLIACAILLHVFLTKEERGMALVGMAAALAICMPDLSGVTLKAALKTVEWNLLLFMAGTLVIGEALIETGAAQMGVSGEMQCDEFSKISRRTMGSTSSSPSKGRPAPNALLSASAASGPISRWTTMAAAFAMRAWACPLVRATIRTVLNFQAPCPICRSLPVIDDCLQRWCSVARS